MTSLQDDMIEEILYLLSSTDEDDDFAIPGLQKKIEGMFGEDCWDALLEEVEDYPELLRIIPPEKAFSIPEDWEINSSAQLEKEIEKHLSIEIQELLQNFMPVDNFKRTSYPTCEKGEIKPLHLTVTTNKKPLNVIVRFECDENGEITRTKSCITDGQNVICESSDLHESPDVLENCFCAKHILDSTKKGLKFALENGSLQDYLQ